MTEETTKSSKNINSETEKSEIADLKLPPKSGDKKENSALKGNESAKANSSTKDKPEKGNELADLEPDIGEKAEPTDPLEIELAKTEKELEAKKSEIKEISNLYKRALADYDNLKRRSAKEVLEASGRGIEQFVKKLLPVLDTFESALRQLTAAKVDKKVLDGFEMLTIQFWDILEKEGLKAIPAKGIKFDPNLHEAVSKTSKDELDDEIVVNEFEKGYLFKERVLRSAKVEINQK